MSSFITKYTIVPTLALLSLTLGMLFVSVPPTPARGDGAPAAVNVDPAAAQFFEESVRPVLATQCYSCHGAETQLAGLRMDSRAALLKGGDSGPALVAGDPSHSLLLTAVRQTSALKMPKGGRLKPSEVAALTAWVKMGAPWPSAASSSAASAEGYVISPEAKRFWSFQPVVLPKTPVVRNTAWAKTPLDKFVLAKLEAKGLAPAPPASKRVLIRRATFDLTGLPPTPAEITSFLQDKSPNAFAQVVDRLLASPRYGECWGRHWLDVARYADTKGYAFGEERAYPHAYTYRDWVVRAFNEDLPYDEFIREQIAADRLPTAQSRRNSLAALGFLTVGRRFLNSDPDIINDRIDVTMRGVEGMTVACARCHNHKFDPIPTKDYYSLYAVFASSKETSPSLAPASISAPYDQWRKQVSDHEAREQAIVMAQVAALRVREKASGAAFPKNAEGALQATREYERPSPDNLRRIEPLFSLNAQTELSALRMETAALRQKAPPAPELGMGMEDAPNPVHQHIFIHGNPGNQGEDAPPRFLQVLSNTNRQTWDNGSGRLELAQALTAKTNPLTARVFVNRVWLSHFGAGLVRTPSDFGKQGDRPVTPELLDYLAYTFMAKGWSVKALQRTIMLSATYQQSSDNPNPKALLADPDNRLLWHMNRRRLELESLRDSLLFASGALDIKTVGGPSVDIWATPFSPRRTVYGLIDRQNLPGVYRTFDLASPDTTSPQRFVTTVPQQALFFLNSPFVATQTQELVARPEFVRLDEPARIRFLYLRLFGRLPTAPEAKIGQEYLKTAPSAKVILPKTIWSYGYGRYDPKVQRLVGFTPLPKSDGQGWHGAGGFPDPELHYLRLTEDGGHPGFDSAHDAVRRWTAPQSGKVSVQGMLQHGQMEGDGVIGRIVSSRQGLLGEWSVHHGQAQTNVTSTLVQQGDTLDFVVDCGASDNNDTFQWAPIIRSATGEQTWNARMQFNEREEIFRPLTAWESYTQALLMTNEFMFID